MFLWRQWEWVGGEGTDGSVKVGPSEVVKGAKDENNYFDFLLLTMNEDEKICECSARIRIDNWKNRFQEWLKMAAKGKLFNVDKKA